MAWGSDGWSSQTTAASSAVTAPVVTRIRTDAAENTFWNVNSGGITQSNNNKIFGTTIYPNSTVSVYRDAVLQGEVSSDGSGNWVYNLGLTSDGGIAITATVTTASGTSSPSIPFNYTVQANITGVSLGVPILDYGITSDFIQISGEQEFFCDSDDNASPNTSPLIATTTHQLDFRSQIEDRHGSDQSNRTEVTAGYSKYPDGTIFTITFEFMLNASDPVHNAGVLSSYGTGGLNGSCCIIQLHDDAATPPPFRLFLGVDANGDALGVQVRNLSSGAWIYPYLGPSNLARGVWHHIDIRLKFGTAASGALCQVWLNNVQVSNVSGVGIGAVSPYRIAFGIYRNPPAQTQLQRMSVRNFLVAYL